MDPFQSSTPSNRYPIIGSHPPAQPQPQPPLQPSEIAHEAAAPTPLDNQIDQAIANNDNLKLTTLITSQKKDLTPQQLLRIGDSHPAFVPLIAKNYPAIMPELLLYLPQEELRAHPGCIRECIRHGARIDIAKENQPTVFSLLCREPSLHEIVRDIINGDLVQTSQTTSPKRPSEEPSPHAKRQRITEQKDGPHAEDIGSKEMEATRNKGKKKRTDDEEATTSRVFTTEEAPQYLVDGLCEAIRAHNNKAVAYFFPHRAIYMGTPSNTKETIADIAIQSKNRWAMCALNLRYAQALLEGNIELAPQSLWNLLRSAIREGQEMVVFIAVQYLKNNPAYASTVLNMQDEKERTLLHHAASPKSLMLPLLAKLIDLGANPAVEDEDGNTIFHLLADASGKHPEARQLLRELIEKHKESLDIQDEEGQTILHILLNEDPVDIDLVKHLLDLGADPTIQDDDGDTLLHLLAHESGEHPESGELLRELIEKHKESLDIQGEEGQTILHILLNEDPVDIDLVKHLLDLGADPTIQDDDGDTLLHLLADASGEHPKAGELLRELIEKHNDSLDIQNSEGETISHILLMEPVNVDLAKHALDLGADPAVQDDEGNTLFHLLADASEQHPEAGKLLQELTELHNDSLDIQNREGETVSHILLNKAPVDINLVKHVLDLGANPTIQGDDGDTVLHMLAYAYKSEGNLETRQLLIKYIEKHKDALNIQNQDGETLFYTLSQVPDPDTDLLKKLLHLGANPCICNNDGVVPLITLKNIPDEELQQLLYRRKDTDFISTRDKVKRTPLGIMAYHDPEHTRALLLRIIPWAHEKEALLQRLLQGMIPAGGQESNTITFIRESTLLAQQLCSETTTPLEVAFLLGGVNLMKTMLEQLTEAQRIQGAKILLERYPEQTPLLMDLLFSVDDYHMHLGNIRVSSEIPDIELRDVQELSQLLQSNWVREAYTPVSVNGQILTLEKLNEKLMKFLNRVANEKPFEGTPPEGSEGLQRYYNSIKKALTHLMTYFEKTRDPKEIINTCAELASVSTLCGGPYYERPITLYRQYCDIVPDTFENMTYRHLQGCRNEAVAAMVAREPYINHEQSVHADSYIKKHIGYEMQLTDAIEYARRNDPYEMTGFDEEFAEKSDKIEHIRQRFFVYYTPSSMVNFMQQIQMPNSKEANEFVTWGSSNLKTELVGAWKKITKEKKKEIAHLQERLARLATQLMTKTTNKKSATAKQEVNKLKAEMRDLVERIAAVAGEEYAPSQYASATQQVKDTRQELIHAELMDETGVPKPFALAMMLKKLGAIRFA